MRSARRFSFVGRAGVAAALAVLAACVMVATPAFAAYRQTYLYVSRFSSLAADADSEPYGLAFDALSNLYLAGNGEFFTRFAPTASIVATYDDDTYTNFAVGQDLDQVRGFAVYGSNIWVCDYSNGIAQFTTSNAATGRTIESAQTAFANPECVAVDAAGNVFVGDNGSEAGIYSQRISKFDANGVFHGVHFGDGAAGTSPLTRVHGVAVAPNGEVYVADGGGIARYHPTPGSSTAYTRDSEWTRDVVDSPVAVAYGAGSVFVVDSGSGSVSKLDVAGNVVANWTGAGTAGGPFTNPMGVAVAPNGHVFVTDRDSATVREFVLQDLGPLTYAAGTVTVKKGKTAKLKYEVKDDISNSCKVTLKIYKGSKPKATISCGTVSQAAWHTKSWKCKLAKGSYTWRVYASDLSSPAHTQRNVASKTFKVK